MRDFFVCLLVAVFGALISQVASIRTPITIVRGSYAKGGDGVRDFLRGKVDATASSRNDGEEGEVHAVLMAGSNDFWNYRHQADIAHAYWLLREGGVKAENIVTIMFNDVVNDPENPAPGKLFNRPGGPDVYRSLPVDYRGPECTAEVLYNVLKGNCSGVEGLGTGRVLSAGPSDRVFVYYSDHGGPGVLGVPSGEMIYGDRLVQSLQYRSANQGFRELTFYLEACESGSIFQGAFPEASDDPIYATSAANEAESSWATYCPGMPSDPPLPQQWFTCLGDLYSVAWMEDAEARDLGKESLEGQFLRVKARTSNDFSYDMGSHALQFGSPSIPLERSAAFEGRGNVSWLQATSEAGPTASLRETYVSISQREVKLHYLKLKALSFPVGSEERRGAEARLRAEEERRRAVEAGVARIFSASLERYMASAQFPSDEPLPPLLSLALDPPSPRTRASLLRTVLPRRGRPVVDDWECYREYIAHCRGTLDFTQDDTDLLAAFANLCNSGVRLSSGK